VARNTTLTASAEVLGKLCALAFFVLIARKLGDATLGDYVFALALSSLIWSFAGFGLDRMATRDIARDLGAAERLVFPIAIVKVVACLALTALSAVVVALLGQSDQRVALVLLVGVSIALTLAAATAQAVFTAHERMEFVFLTRVPSAIVAAAAGIAVLLLGGGIVTACAVSLVGVGALTTIWTFLLLSRHIGTPRTERPTREWASLVRAAVPFGLQEMLGQVIFRFDTVLLALVATSAVVGAYGAAFRLLEATLFLPWSIGYAVLPMYSYMERRGDDLNRVYEGSLKLVLVVTAPIAAIFLVCAGPIVELLYGDEQFDETVSLLRILAPAVVVYGIGHLAGMLVLVRRPGRVTVRAAAAVAAVNIALCAFAIPWLGAEGAAISTLVAELLLAALGLALVRPVVSPRLGWVFLSPLLAACAMGLAMTAVADTLYLAVPLGLLVYGVVLVALEAGRLRDDIRLYRSIAGARAEAPVAPDAVVAP
jgi:O-antigen/teichoic acid export membrane protein